MNITSAVDLFITAHAGMNYNQRSLNLYNWSLNLLADFTKDAEISAVTIADLRRFRAAQGSREAMWDDHPTRPTVYKPISPYTVLGHVRRVRAFFAWLTEEGYLPADPAKRLELPKLDKIAPKDLPPAAINTLIKSAKTDRDKAIIRILAESGCRVGGLSRLNVGDVDLTIVDGRASARVVEKRRERLIFFTAETAEILKRYLDNSRRAAPGAIALFTSNKRGQRLTTSGIYQILKREAKATGLKRYNPHGMRHATARRVIDHDGSLEDVSAILGHTTSQVTKQFYSGWNDNKDTRRRHAMFAAL